MKHSLNMRTKIEIDDKLMEAALKAGGVRTKREVVAQFRKAFVLLKEQEKLREFRGKLVWDDDLDRMRGA